MEDLPLEAEFDGAMAEILRFLPWSKVGRFLPLIAADASVFVLRHEFDVGRRTAASIAAVNGRKTAAMG